MSRLFKRRQRIYCFPNRYGFAAFALFLVMLAVGGSYQNNLVFMMAFLSISIALVAILQTARNIRDFDVIAMHVASSFAGAPTTATLTLINRSTDTKINLELFAEFTGGVGGKETIRVPFEIASFEKQSTQTTKNSFPLPTRRGRYRLKRVCISTTAPYGLFRAWIYFRTDSEFLVYPAPGGIRELPTERLASGEDFSGHKAYVPGDPMGRIDWKVYSRRREHYIKEFKDGSHTQVDLKLNENDHDRIETQLSQLSLWIDEAYQKQYDFRLETKSFRGGYGSSQAHYHRCLSELALWSA